MKPETEVRVGLAEDDFATAEWLLERPDLLPRSVGFSAQQCVEKYLKGVAEEASRPMPRIHDLRVLFDGVADLVPELAPLQEDVSSMTPFAGVLRYPYDESLFPKIEDAAEQAAATMRTVRSIVRAALGIPPQASAEVGAG